MQIFITFCGLLAAASAASISYYAQAPGLRAYPLVYGGHSSSLFTPLQQQYHSQDELGQYAYGYSEPHSTKQEVRSLDGITRGSYSYRDAAGIFQTVDYTADAEGFHVAATNLPRADGFRNTQKAPTPVADTYEVAAARAAHFAAHEEARLRLAKSNTAGIESGTASTSGRSVELPRPVADTNEVAAARADHLKRHEFEKLRNEAQQEQQEIIGSIPAAVAYQSVYPSVYSYNYPLNSRFLSSGFYY